MVMNEHTQDAVLQAIEQRSRDLLERSVDGLDMRVRSRLTQARHAALDAAAAAARRPWFLDLRILTPAAGMAAAAVLGLTLWFAMPDAHHEAATADQPSLEDLDMVASSDGSGDAIDMLQNDLDFYDFADKASNSGPAA